MAKLDALSAHLAALSAAFSWASTALAQEPAAPIDVVVQGERHRPPAPPKDRSVAGSVVRGDRLRAAGLQAADVLRTQPGLSVVETGGQGALATASIRGATSAQTPVYLAGIRLNDDVAGTADLSLVPLWLIDRVEIYRGNAPIEADQLGIGGAIFFEPRRPGRPGAGAGTTLGSFGTRSIWADASTGAPHASALVGVRIDSARNDYSFLDDRGTRFDPGDDRVRTRTNSDVHSLDFWTIGSARLGAGWSADMVVNAVGREQGVPGLLLLPTRAARAALQRSILGGRLRAPCGRDDRCRIEVSSSALVARSTLHDPDLELALGAARVDNTGQRTEHGVSARIDLSDAVTVSPSASASFEGLRVTALGASGLDATRTRSRLASGMEWRAGQLATFRALGSAECHGTSSEGWSFCDRLEPSGRIGVQLGRGRVVGLANASRYARVPTLGELYGTSGLVRGNPQLVPEEGLGVDAGIRVAAGRWRGVRGAWLDLFAFARWSDRLVAWRRSGLGYIRPYNVGSARVTGLEGLAAIEPAAWLRAELAATVMDPRDTTSGRMPANDLLPFRSRLVISPALECRTTRWRSAGIARASALARWTWQSSRYADEAGLVVIPSQGSLDLESEVRLLSERLAIRARLANLLDQRRFDVIGYALPGRSLYATMEARW